MFTASDLSMAFSPGPIIPASSHYVTIYISDLQTFPTSTLMTETEQVSETLVFN
jgi:hypothetical protein